MTDKQKKNLMGILIAIFSVGIFVFLLFTCGCTMSNNMREKSINTGMDIIGVKVTVFDPATGTMAPTGFVAWGSAYYHSIPVAKGQAFRVKREFKSFWTSEVSETVLIEVGEAPINGRLEVEKNCWIGTQAEFIPESK